MDKLVYLLPVLGCAIMMGLMMWMMRGSHADHTKTAQTDPNTAEEIAILRAEVEGLRAQQAGPVRGNDRSTQQ